MHKNYVHTMCIKQSLVTVQNRILECFFFGVTKTSHSHTVPKLLHLVKARTKLSWNVIYTLTISLRNTQNRNCGYTITISIVLQLVVGVFISNLQLLINTLL